MATLLPFLVFLLTVLVTYAIGRRLMGPPRAPTPEEEFRLQPVFGRATPLIAGLFPTSPERSVKLRRDLNRAGYYQPNAVDQYRAIRNLTLLGWMSLIAFAIVVAFDPQRDPTLTILIVGLVVSIFIFAGPRLYLQIVASRRVEKIENDLPDALDMITMCLNGGLSLPQSLERVGRELRGTHTELATELEIVRRHADTYSLNQAMERFAQRIDTPDVSSLAGLVAYTEQLGTNVASALRGYADTIRRRHRQRAEERGNRNSVQMLLPVALCLAPPVYILLLGPAFLEIRDFLIRERRPGGVLAQQDDQWANGLLPTRQGAGPVMGVNQTNAATAAPGPRAPRATPRATP